MSNALKIVFTDSLHVYIYGDEKDIPSHRPFKIIDKGLPFSKSVKGYYIKTVTLAFYDAIESEVYFMK